VSKSQKWISLLPCDEPALLPSTSTMSLLGATRTRSTATSLSLWLIPWAWDGRRERVAPASSPADATLSRLMRQHATGERVEVV